MGKSPDDHARNKQKKGASAGQLHAATKVAAASKQKKQKKQKQLATPQGTSMSKKKEQLGKPPTKGDKGGSVAPGKVKQPDASAVSKKRSREDEEQEVDVAQHQDDGDLSWPYPTDYNDHFETSHQALADIEPLLFRFASRIGKTKAELVVYDPYFCQGAIRQHYNKLGIKKLIHEKRDFYADIEANKVPDYDILITNPPYSLDHKERILSFCAASGKPWALLMPNYVANKRYYLDLVTNMAEQEAVSAPFFLVPQVKYEYFHPQGTGHASSPFFSIWFLHLGEHTPQIANWWEKQLTQRSKKDKDNSEASAIKPKLMRDVSALQEEEVVPTWKRPNPKARRKLKKLRQEEDG